MNGPTTVSTVTVDNVPRYRDRIKRWLVLEGVPPADAEDVTQEVLSAAVRYFSTYDPAKGTFLGWLKQIARNEAKRYFKKRGEVPPELLAEPDAVAETPERIAFDIEMERALTRVLDDLDAAERELLGMRFYEGLTAGEISERLEIPEATVRSRLFRTLERCREGFGALGVKDRPGSLLVPLLLAGETEKREQGSGGVAAVSPGSAPAQRLPLARRVLRSRWTAFVAGGALVYLLLQWQHRPDLLACGVWPRMMPIPLECGGEQGSSKQSAHSSVESAPSPMKRPPAQKPVSKRPAEPFTEFSAAEGARAP